MDYRVLPNSAKKDESQAEKTWLLSDVEGGSELKICYQTSRILSEISYFLKLVWVILNDLLSILHIANWSAELLSLSG